MGTDARVDPINSYMNYDANDNCRATFTAGQAKRMRSMYNELRDIDKKTSPTGTGENTDLESEIVDHHEL
jgi:SET domain-containing protein